MRSTRKIFQSVTVCGRILPIVTSSSAESTRLQQTNENQNLPNPPKLRKDGNIDSHQTQRGACGMASIFDTFGADQQ